MSYNVIEMMHNDVLVVIDEEYKILFGRIIQKDRDVYVELSRGGTIEFSKLGSNIENGKWETMKLGRPMSNITDIASMTFWEFDNNYEIIWERDKVKLKNKIQAIKDPINTNGDKLEFSDGSYIKVEYRQECCEINYADWRSLDDTGFYDEVFDEICLEKWSGGFKINGYPVNCYSIQNGYYTNSVNVEYILKDNAVLGIKDVRCKL